MALFLVLRHEPTLTPPWLPVQIVEKTLEEGGEAAIAELAEANPAAASARLKAVRFDDGPEMVPTMKLKSAPPIDDPGPPPQGG